MTPKVAEDIARVGLSAHHSAFETMMTERKFECKHTLYGHAKAVNVLTISPDQTFLLSGGDDCSLIVWDLISGNLLQTIDVRIHGPVSTATWVWVEQDYPSSGFCFGCADGTILYFKKDAPLLHFSKVCIEHTSRSRASVEAMAFDPDSGRLATASGGATKVWQVLSNGLTEVHCTETWDLIVSSLLFLQSGAMLVVSYLENCEVVCYETKSWSIAWRRTLRTRLGCVTGNPDRLFVSNLLDGLDVYTMPPMRLIKTHRQPIKQNFRLQLASLCDGEFVAVGSEAGTPSVFNPVGGLHQTLEHGDIAVPTIASSDSGERYYIVTGATESPFDVKVWATGTAATEDVQSSIEPQVNQSLPPRQLLLITLLCALTQLFVANFDFLGRLGGEAWWTISSVWT
ncbi:hypothetical protein NMY22_g19299 [Coprinellus aureogranulatus]|nr:hypothetical protein NMY22_g19299 [Coprinellus aureogranulatus]